MYGKDTKYILIFKKIKCKQDGLVILLHCNVQVSITDENQFLNRKMQN